MVTSNYKDAKGPEVIARLIGKVVKSETPKTRYAAPFATSGLYFFMKGLLGDRLFDQLILSQLK